MKKEKMRHKKENMHRKNKRATSHSKECAMKTRE